MSIGAAFIYQTCLAKERNGPTILSRGHTMVEREQRDGVVVDGVELSNDERQPCEVWTRVMGYYRPVHMYNTGKKGEFHERVEFVMPE